MYWVSFGTTNLMSCGKGGKYIAAVLELQMKNIKYSKNFYSGVYS